MLLLIMPGKQKSLHKSVIFFLLICHETIIQIMTTERAVPEQFEENSINSFNAEGARTWLHTFT